MPASHRYFSALAAVCTFCLTGTSGADETVAAASTEPFAGRDLSVVPGADFFA